jgi:NADH-quinone oxidoreductase subunit J
VSFDLPTILPIACGAVALLGALAVAATRDVMRLIFGLGVVLLAVTGLFALAGASFLAVAEVFIYVGGVLVLFLFSIMLVHRSEGTRPVLESRHDLLSLVVAGGTFFMIVSTLGPAASKIEPSAMVAGVEALSDTLLDSMLIHFEVAGILLLAALVAVVSILGDDRR